MSLLITCDYKNAADMYSSNRSALNDVTSTSVNTPIDNTGGDIKRQKLANGHSVGTNGQVVTG